MSPISQEKVRVRFPPSPTGLVTMGTIRAVLSPWLFTRQKKGTFILRIEDTDHERSKQEFEYDITETLHWFGIDWDEGPDWQNINGSWQGTSKGEYGPYRQSERTQIYKKYLEQLLSEGKAYYCYCTKEELEAQKQSLEAQGLPAKYVGHCRELTQPPGGRTDAVIRLKVPEVIVEFKDLIRSTVSFDAKLIGDIIIARSIDSALYHFAVVVDDELMKITHIIRGEDHISNTPKHILIQKALGFGQPVYAHFPMVLGPDGKKLSKRKTEISILQYREKGYLPEAIINFIALLGWHPQDNQEIFTVEELIEKFDIKRVQKGGAIFNVEKLDWINAQHIKLLSDEELHARLQPFLVKAGIIDADPELIARLIHTQRERLKVLSDFVTQNDFFFALPEYDANLLVWKNDLLQKTREILPQLRDALETLPEKFSRQDMIQCLETLITTHGRGSILWPLRVALSGRSASPDPTEIAEILGKVETLRRVQLAGEKCQQIMV